MSDMARLKVQPPDTLTRVTEYVPEIVAYVERIIANGYAYATSDGSVYFDTQAFDGAKAKEGAENPEWNHSYAKLMPWNKGNKELIEEGEGLVDPTISFQTHLLMFGLWIELYQALCLLGRGSVHLQISRYGKHPSLGNQHGRLLGVQGDQGGTSSAPLWPPRSSATTWISTQGVSILRSPTMTMRLHSLK